MGVGDGDGLGLGEGVGLGEGLGVEDLAVGTLAPPPHDPNAAQSTSTNQRNRIRSSYRLMGEELARNASFADKI